MFPEQPEQLSVNALLKDQGQNQGKGQEQQQIEEPAQRKIIHIDMDAFFASVEQRDFPDLQGKPVIVGGQPDSRGVVAACSYEARKFGIHSAMASSRAYRLCPQAIFVKPRFEAYRQASTEIHEVFREITDLIEPLSLDEAYLDVTGSTEQEGSATRIAQLIKQRILLQTDLVASAGVSYNKFLAKIASDMDKPDGLFVIRPEQGVEFVSTLPVKKIHGVGKVTEKKMLGLGIETGADLRSKTLLELQQYFGKSAQYYFNIARAIDERPVRSSRKRKSIGIERTYPEDMKDLNLIKQHLTELLEKGVERMKVKQCSARTLTLKLKYDNFEQVTRSQTTEQLYMNVKQCLPVLFSLLNKTEAGERAVRLLGLSFSGLTTGKQENLEQLSLFENEDV
ncbi:MAG: DNA polymerase IV [Pseudomonadales bacterium]|nr:DNA polymerase IV [Pseudomonadales bacterium]